MDADTIASRFGLDGPARLSDGPVARGRQGTVWRLDAAGAAWAVKTAFEPADEDEAQVPTAFQEAAYDAGVPTPGVRRTTDGRVFADLGDEQVRLYTWVDMCALDPHLDPVAVGELVAALHRLPVLDAGEPVDDWYCRPVGAPTWDLLVAELTEAGAPFAHRLADLRDELVAVESWVEPPQATRTCHRDLWADNLRATTDGGLCLVDWENSGPADPAQELACVLFEFGGSEPARAVALDAAYRAAGGPAAVRHRGDFSMLIASLGHIMEIAARDWLRPNARSPQRADAEAWISEGLDQPHTRATLDGLLTAVTAGRV